MVAGSNPAVPTIKQNSSILIVIKYQKLFLRPRLYLKICHNQLSTYYLLKSDLIYSFTDRF